MAKVAVLSHRGVADELGHIGEWLETRDSNVVRLWREDPLALPDADVLIVMGSPTSVADGHRAEAAQREIELVTSWVRDDRPYLGVCFGAQVLAAATGGRVTRMSGTRRAFTGLDTGKEFLSGRWAVWHEDALSAPAPSETVATLPWADAVFRVGRAWGLQPHVEFSSDIVERLARSISGPDETWRELWSDLRDDDEGHRRRSLDLLDALDLFDERVERS